MTIARFLPIAAVAAMAIYAAPASANNVTYNFGTITPGTTAVTTPPINHLPGSFDDTLTFTLSAGGSGSVAYAELEFVNQLGAFYDIGPVNFTLVNNAAPATFLYNGALTSNSPQTINFAPGSYTAHLTGTATGSQGGAYAFAVSAPAVPEPAAWGTMLLGVGLTGALARRRKRTAAAA